MLHTVIDHLCRQFINMLSYKNAALNICILRWEGALDETWCLVSSKEEFIWKGIYNSRVHHCFFFCLLVFWCFSPVFLFSEVSLHYLSHSSVPVAYCWMHFHDRHIVLTVLNKCMPFLGLFSFFSTSHGSTENTKHHSCFYKLQVKG